MRRVCVNSVAERTFWRSVSTPAGACRRVSRIRAPGGLVLARLEARRVVSLDRELVAALAHRDAARHPRRRPSRRRRSRRRASARCGRRRTRLARRRSRRSGASAAREPREGERLAGREAARHLQVRERVLVAVAIGVVAVGAIVRGARRVDLASARGERNGGRALDGGEPGREARLGGAPVARGGEEARPGGGAREDLHDAADGVGPVQARQRTLHDLDALDQLERMFSMEVVPTVAELTRRPSTSTSVWPALAPRRISGAGPRRRCRGIRRGPGAGATRRAIWARAVDVLARVITSMSRSASAARAKPGWR